MISRRRAVRSESRGREGRFPAALRSAIKPSPGPNGLLVLALALLVGLLTGSYSSIFIAAPLLAMFKQREPRFRTLRGAHATGAELEHLVLGGSPSAKRDAARHRTDSADGEVLLPVTKGTPESLLTHPPRPRKKKRR